jgi:hypothetical protein
MRFMTNTSNMIRFVTSKQNSSASIAEFLRNAGSLRVGMYSEIWLHKKFVVVRTIGLASREDERTIAIRVSDPVAVAEAIAMSHRHNAELAKNHTPARQSYEHGAGIR